MPPPSEAQLSHKSDLDREAEERPKDERTIPAPELSMAFNGDASARESPRASVDRLPPLMHWPARSPRALEALRMRRKHPDAIALAHSGASALRARHLIGFVDEALALGIPRAGLPIAAFSSPPGPAWTRPISLHGHSALPGVHLGASELGAPRCLKLVTVSKTDILYQIRFQNFTDSVHNGGLVCSDGSSESRRQPYLQFFDILRTLMCLVVDVGFWGMVTVLGIDPEDPAPACGNGGCGMKSKTNETGNFGVLFLGPR